VHRCGLLLQMSHTAWPMCLRLDWTHWWAVQTTEPIEMPFGGWLMWVQGNIYWGQIGRIHSQPRGVTIWRWGLFPNNFGHLFSFTPDALRCVAVLCARRNTTHPVLTNVYATSLIAGRRFTDMQMSECLCVDHCCWGRSIISHRRPSFPLLHRSTLSDHVIASLDLDPATAPPCWSVT